MLTKWVSFFRLYDTRDVRYGMEYLLDWIDAVHRGKRMGVAFDVTELSQLHVRPEKLVRIDTNTHRLVRDERENIDVTPCVPVVPSGASAAHTLASHVAADTNCHVTRACLRFHA